MDFQDRIVMVTAGAAGIGAAIAGSFLKQGAKVHIVDIDRQAVERFIAQYPDATTSVADVKDMASVERVFDSHKTQFPGLDVLVNCAGIAGPTALTEDVSIDDWRECIAVNLDSTFMFTQHAIVLMKVFGHGNIINISSTAGWHGYPMRTPYASAKWAIIGFTKSVAMELGPAGIRVNVICPGSVNGERMDKVIAAEAKKKSISEQEIRYWYTQSSSLKTFVEQQDIANMALFLCSDGAARITGQVLNVDGHLESFSGAD